MNKPIAGKPFSFEMATRIGVIVQCVTVDGFLSLIDNYVWDTFGEELSPEGITYKPIRIEGENTIIIQVDCENMEADNEEE